ncbi:MAG: sugar ABC transporter substrate-binding protein [Clostridiales Family XIII bacterium]|nr:sugar ABC transporter substrate-binding protein [Clostridiales Family XIII bacterium]
MKMRKLWAVVLCVVMVLATFAACTSEKKSDDGGSSDSDSKSDGGGKYALIMSHMTNAFVTTVADAAKAEAEKEGVELNVFDGKQDAATQISQIESCIAQGYAGIVVEPVSVDGIIPAIKEANEAKIPVITVVQQISDQSLVAAYVGGDEIKAGELEMKEALATIGGKGNIAILYGPMGSDAQLIRKEGYDNILKENPDVKVVFEQTANWTSDEALKVVENWLQTGTEINAIVSQNDGMAVGAMKAVEDAKKKGEIGIFGIDATPDGVSAIKDGRMDGTVSQGAANMGTIGIETIIKVAKGEKVDPLIYTEAEWVNSENIADYE